MRPPALPAARRARRTLPVRPSPPTHLSTPLLLGRLPARPSAPQMPLPPKSLETTSALQGPPWSPAARRKAPATRARRDGTKGSLASNRRLGTRIDCHISRESLSPTETFGLRSERHAPITGRWAATD